MFGWRRKPDGFDWHKYVRTTIKLRRQERRDKINGAAEAAGAQVKAAGKAAASGAKVAGKAAASGAKVAGQAAVKGGVSAARGAAHAFVSGIAASFSAAGKGLDPIGHGIARTTHPMLLGLSRPPIGVPIALAGAAAAIAAVYRWSANGVHGDALTPLLFGFVLLALAVPAALGRVGVAIPAKPKSGRTVAVASLVGLLSGGCAVALAVHGPIALPSLAAFSKFKLTSSLVASSAKSIEGRAAVIAGDILRIDQLPLRLAGIEAPDRQQSCQRQPGNKRWRCGEAAQNALEKLTRGRTLVCEVSGADDSGRGLAKCTADGRDIAAELVKDGHVFARASFYGGYGALETEAKRNKSGLWTGEAERPSEFRAKLWETAKKSAPEGCPIKGRVTASGKVYVLPWSPDYSAASVRTTRGERWFCSEPEAQAAGWRAS